MKNIAFCSGGKDSVAQLIIAKEMGEPLDAAVFAEVMFDDETSGEHPLHRDFVYSKLQPFVTNKLKIPFIVLRSDKTYKDYFFHTISRGEGAGKVAGFPIPGLCAINRDCKLRAIAQFLKGTGRNCKTQYVGIANDEPKRLKRLDGTSKVSLLDKYNVTESECRALAKNYDLLSPVYDISKRNGCWFCMNCKDDEFLWLMNNAPELFEELIQMEQTPNLYRKCLTRTETPSQVKARLENYAQQITFFD